MARVLIAEDEMAIADAVVYALRTEGMEVEHCLLGQQVVPNVRRGGIDVVILDVGLPDISGFDVCRQLRTFSDVPVVFLTARTDEIDKVLGLELGADDYVSKPFSPRELVARVRARLRRSGASDAGEWHTAGPFDIDQDGHQVRFHGQALALTRYEFTLLAALLHRPGAILTRTQLMERVWGDADESGDRTVDTHIKTLRAKLRAVARAGDPIRTHRGLGYSVAL